MSSLFRREVLEKQGRRHLGDVIIATPISFWAITFLLLIIILGTLAFAVTTDYSRSLNISGSLIPDTGYKEVFPAHSGTFDTVAVSRGQVVSAQDTLAVLKDGSRVAAPVSGTIAAIIAVSGGPADPQRPAFSLLPENSDPIAEFYVTPDQASELHQGQSIELKYKDLASAQNSPHYGIVTQISAIADPDIRVTVKPVTETGSSKVELRSGMSVTASIPLGRQKIWRLAFNRQGKK